MDANLRRFRMYIALLDKSALGFLARLVSIYAVRI